MNDLFSDLTMVLIKIVILVAAFGVISARLFPKVANTQMGKASNHILMALGVFALLAYVNFQPFTPKPHYQDSFHYYIGSKYFPELGYTRLYACTTRAGAESNNPSERSMAYYRYVRDLSLDKDNGLVPGGRYYSDDVFCKSHFSAPRWEAFKSDIEFFHDRNGVNKYGLNMWEEIHKDHGFNASPAWTLVGGFLSNIIPLSDSALTGIALIDIAFLFGSIACLAWAFGLPTAALAVIVGTASIETWGYIGGSMLRFDWLFMAILSVCALKRGHYVLAGAALGYAAMMRLFPAVFALGPFFGLLYAIYKRQHTLKAAYGKFFGGMVISVAILAASAVSVYGTSAYKDFFSNTSRMSNTLSVNTVGLQNVLTTAYDSSIRHGRKGWNTAIIEARQKVVPIYVLVVAIALLLFIPAAISCEPWQAVAFGALFTPFMWTELSHYYYLFLMVVATLFAANWKVALPLLGIGIAIKIGWAFRMYEMIDILSYYFIFSTVVCIGAMAIWWQAKTRSFTQ